MAEDGFKNMIYGFVLLTLFMFLTLTFVTQVAMDNNKDTTELEKGAFSLNQYEDFLEGVDDQAEVFQKDRFANQNIFITLGDLIISGLFRIAIDMLVFITTPFTLIAQVLNNVLGVPTLVISVVLGLIIFSIIFGIWRLIKIGD